MSREEEQETAEPQPPSAPGSVEDGVAAARALISHTEAVIARAREVVRQRADFLRRHRAPK